MAILISLVSVFLITGVVSVAKSLTTRPICPLCIGVSATWFWIILGVKMNLLGIDWLILAAVLIGTSILGIVDVLKKRKPRSLTWKSVFTALGFLVALLVLKGPVLFVLIIAATLVIFGLYVWRPIGATPDSSSEAKKLEEKMKNCC